MSTKTALIVDDEAAIRLYIKAVLEQQGFETLQAVDGIEALNVLRNNATGADLLISDVQMPKMDGIALTRAVRAEFPAIPLILVSGYCSRDDVADLGVHLIPKPFTPDTLLNAIGCVMKQKKEPNSETEPRTSMRNRNTGG